MGEVFTLPTTAVNIDTEEKEHVSALYFKHPEVHSDNYNGLWAMWATGYHLETLSFKNNSFKGKNSNFYSEETWETPSLVIRR